MLFGCAAALGALALVCSNNALAQRAGGGGDAYRPPTGGTSSFGPGKPEGAGGSIVATPITPQEAAKKYPARNGRYPMGERDPHDPSGVVRSPYPPHTKFDCSKIAHGGLVLDTHVNKVFVRP